jgi:proline iminopeptidase
MPAAHPNHQSNPARVTEPSMAPQSAMRVPRVTGGHIVRDQHRIAFAIAGAPAGIPIAVLHGGPGSGSRPSSLLKLFDLDRFTIVAIDQRGAGKSRPNGSVRHNRTDRLVDDMEAVRRHLGFERWGVLGGSWGAALALAYAGRYPERVMGVVLRGVFLTSRAEVRGLFVTSRRRAPRQWAALARAAQCTRAAALLACCARALEPHTAPARQLAVAKAWETYEVAVLASARAGRARAHARRSPVLNSDRRLIGKYRVQAHYLKHDCWLGERRLLSLARQAAGAGVPIAAVHGLRDPVCPIGNVERLARAVPTLRTTRVQAGHLGSEPPLASGVARAIKAMFAARPD